MSSRSKTATRRSAGSRRPPDMQPEPAPLRRARGRPKQDVSRENLKGKPGAAIADITASTPGLLYQTTKTQRHRTPGRAPTRWNSHEPYGARYVEDMALPYSLLKTLLWTRTLATVCSAAFPAGTEPDRDGSNRSESCQRIGSTSATSRASRGWRSPTTKLRLSAPS